MLNIQDSEKIVVEVDHWVNKSIGRASIEVKKVDFFSNETVLSKGELIHFHDVNDLKVLFPWADLSVDSDFYDNYLREEHLNEHGVWDPIDKDFVGHTVSLEEYKTKFPTIWGIPDSSGEIETYRLELSLNSLGKSFLEINNYLDFGLQLELYL
jgi:hypothetical protein